MSTGIKSVFQPEGFDVIVVRDPADARRIAIHPKIDGKTLGTITITRADFLAAVETECGVRIVPADAIVIDRAELPEVVGTTGEDPEWYAFADGRPRGILVGDEHYDRAVAYLAAHEYEAAHPPTPPVDEADVEALGDLIRQYGDDLHSLLATGRVSVTHE